MREKLTPKAIKELEKKWVLQNRAIELLDIISSEFKSDPTSTQCFDLRIVKECIDISEKLKEMEWL